MEIVKIGVNVIDVNNGQIDGLQRNPRTITKADITKIANSIKETPELFDIRPCIVYPLGGRFVLIGGNLRFLGAVQLKYKTIPCVVLSADTPVEKLREIVIKDNGSFGAWDYDLLANEWNDVPLTDWGVDVWETPAVPDHEETEQPAPVETLPKITLVFDDESTRSRFLACMGETIKADYNATIIEK